MHFINDISCDDQKIILNYKQVAPEIFTVIAQLCNLLLHIELFREVLEFLYLLNLAALQKEF